MPSEDEIRFAKDRARLQTTLHEIISTADLIFGLDMIESSSQLIPFDGVLRPDTLAGQEILIHWRFQLPNGLRHKIEVAIGPTGERWHPVITLTDSLGTSAVFTLQSKGWPEMHDLRRAIIVSLNKIKYAQPDVRDNLGDEPRDREP